MCTLGELYVDYISIKLLKKKNLNDLGFGGNFLATTRSSTIHEERKWGWASLKLKLCYNNKNTSHRIGVKFEKDISDKGIALKISKNC